MLKHLVFDCDGVLWQGTNDGYFQCYHRAALEAGVALDYEVARLRILQNWGQAVQCEIAGLLREHPHLVPQTIAHYERLIRSDVFLNAAELVAGAAETLRVLAQTYTLSAITGMNADNLETLLARFQLRDCFRHTISTSATDDPARQKPSGYHLRQLLATEGLQPHEVLCVGDALADVQMAHSQGVRVVAVLTGHLTEAAARQLNVAGILPSVAALPAWLDARATEGTR